MCVSMAVAAFQTDQSTATAGRRCISFATYTPASLEHSCCLPAQIKMLGAQGLWSNRDADRDVLAGVQGPGGGAAVG